MISSEFEENTKFKQYDRQEDMGQLGIFENSFPIN